MRITSIYYTILHLIFIVLAVGTFMHASAQTANADSAYKLQKRDVILIRLRGEDALSTRVPVGSDGNISFPYVGTVKAEGLTTEELASVIREQLIAMEYYRDPVVTVSIEVYYKPRVTVLGMVLRTGSYEFEYGYRVMDALSLAGNIVPERADLRRTTITHKDSPNESIPLDLYSMLIKGDLSQNYELRDGDMIFIPEDTSNRVFVFGAVIRPGQFLWRENMTLLDALSFAQGERDDAKLSAVTVTRKDPRNAGKVIRYRLDVVSLKDKGDLKYNIMLEPGDVINVPKAKKVNINEVYQYLSTAWLLRNTVFNQTFFRP